VDAKIAESNPVKDITTSENAIMLERILLERADYLFISPEEAGHLIDLAGFERVDFKFVVFSDMPPGGKRYILCSQMVEDDIINRLNRAINEQIPHQGSEE